MPNGEEAYNVEWCRDKHKSIDREFKEVKDNHKDDIENVWSQIRRQNNMLWGVMGLLLMNFGGVIAILVQGK